MEMQIKGKLIDFNKPLVMGIINITPDSFFSNSRMKNADEAKKKIEEMLENGADIIDIGAMSTRPGAGIITEEEEWDRYEPVLDVALKYFNNTIFSVDTFRSSIAKRSVKDYGVSIINDITGGEYDEKMFETVAECKVPYIVMHMVGLPENMQNNVEYKSLLGDILFYFSKKVEELRLLGVSDIIIDPGFGFSKTIDQNYVLLNNLDSFKIFDLPVLAGLSRKTMIRKYLNISPDEALNGTTILNTLALDKGANILRVHDVKEAKQVVELFCKTRNSVEEKWL
ncbi:MAG: dihydropteroate synthase [Bacteroidales bacterium]|jgi:dihydropteroate synthase|nr:dihydropteroate synthase [Bacteroidales bacterium]